LWNVFKTTPPSEAYAVGWRQLIEQFQENGTGYFPYEDQTIALIGEDTSYGLSIMDLMESELDEIGWEIISQDEVSLDATDFTSLLSRIQSNEPDVVWAVQTSSSGAGNLARQFSEAGFEDTHFFPQLRPDDRRCTRNCRRSSRWCAHDVERGARRRAP